MVAIGQNVSNCLTLFKQLVTKLGPLCLIHSYTLLIMAPLSPHSLLISTAPFSSSPRVFYLRTQLGKTNKQTKKGALPIISKRNGKIEFFQEVFNWKNTASVWKTNVSDQRSTIDTSDWRMIKRI